jgi:hypothetical protein
MSMDLDVGGRIYFKTANLGNLTEEQCKEQLAYGILEFIDLEAATDEPTGPPENAEVDEDPVPPTPTFVERMPFEHATYNLVKSQIH